MGSQTVEILRQGILASLTGGWFYDPHQNVFCNAIHLYLWLFLLCTPFVTYLYFSRTAATWIIYCLSSGITISAIKLINLALHVMYDQAQIISDCNLKKSAKGLQETPGSEDGGIEMQILASNRTDDPISRASIEDNNNNNNNSNEMSQANSAMSIEYPEQVTSTIDLKVDVHRKNSSESSESLNETSFSNNHYNLNPTAPSKLDRKMAMKIKSKSEDASTILSLANTSKELRLADECDLLTRSEERQDKFLDVENTGMQRLKHKRFLINKLQRQTSLDSTEANILASQRTLQRHRSTESNDEHRRHHRHHHSAFYHPNHLPTLAPEIYLETNFTTKSELAIEHFPRDTSSKILAAPKKTPMRKDSNSTMSAMQLATSNNSNSNNNNNNNGGPSTSSSARLRRHSNTTAKQQQLPANIVSVRRIKSTALEHCCQIPSISNLSPHPNSVETIAGRAPNPLPPPSKSLVRNPHLQFFSKGASDSNSIDPVYPIAELADEKSLNDSFILTESESDSEEEERSENISDNDDDDDDDDDYDDDDLDNDEKRRKRTSRKYCSDQNYRQTPSPKLSRHEWPYQSNESAASKSTKTEQNRWQQEEEDDKISNKSDNNKAGPSQPRKSVTSESDDKPQTDSETENNNTDNNGSRSPLLEIRSRNPSSRSKNEHKTNACISDGQQPASLPAQDSATIDIDDSEEGAVGGIDVPRVNTKSEDSGCPSSDCEQASASSKDMLLKDQNVPASRRHWFSSDDTSFNIDANNISADVKDEKSDESMYVSMDGLKKKTDDKLTKTSKDPSHGGAIPKAHFAKYESIEEPSNTTKKEQSENNINSLSNGSSSSNSLSGGSCNSLNSGGNRNILELLQQTDDGWILQSAAANTPYLVAQRGELPPLMPIYNTRTDNVFPVARKPYLYLHQYRQYQPKVRSTRNRRQNSSIDTTTSSRDGEDNSSITANGAAAGGSGSIGVGSGWDVLDMKMSERLSTIFFSELMEEQPDRNAQSTQHSSINRMGFGDSMFWGHCNLPAEAKTHPKRYYKFPFKCFGQRQFKIAMDRLQLLALFDRDYSWPQAIAAIVLASLVSILGAILLQLGFYKDIFAFIFCFVMAGSQFSLMKSVQPDASSPIHGYNKAVSYSRPIYFCLCSSIIILCYHLSQSSPTTTQITLFDIPFVPSTFFRIVQDIVSIILLLFPILFSFGLFPQINTFLIYVLEQFDMHIFGGNAVCSLSAAFLAVFRSIFACCMLYGFAFGGLSEPRTTQHVLFSCFCALIVATAYHLSRTASDFTYLWVIIKSSFIIHHDEDEELRRATKLSKQIEQNNKSNSSRSASNGSKNRKCSSVSTAQATSNDQKHIRPSESITNSVCGTINDSDNKALSVGEETAISEGKHDELEDPLPNKLRSTVNARLKNDFFVCTIIGVIVFSLHSSTVFTVLQPELNPVLQAFVIVLGFILHYVIPQARKYLPWLCFAQPILKQKEYGMYESSEAAKVMWFESVYVCFTFIEKNVLLPLVFLSALTSDSALITHKFGIAIGSAVVVLCGLKSFRQSYSDPSSQYIILIFTVLFFQKDYGSASETFLIDYFVVSIIFKKTCEFLLKLQFIVTYIAPWQITWGSAFHAFAQPFSVPHSAMLFLQAALSAVLSTPLNPFLGSAIFLTSYVRPIKFWERDYNTRRIDHSNTRLSSQLDRDLGADDNNLNSIFYEHLTRSLQHSLCGDLLMGRWGNVSQGDCFVLASDYLNCLVHIIELGNGLCTFQMRGLEFRGTYCQQREVEAISEGVSENDGCCCCNPGHFPNFLSVNAMFSTRWLAWQVIASQYILEGYSISDNLAQATLQVYEFRKVLITYYVKSIIYYTIRSPKLQSWLTSPTIQEALQNTMDRSFVDLDPIFNHNLDEDFDFRASGITRLSFCSVYLDWIQFCFSKRNESQKAKSTDKNQQQSQNIQLDQSVSGECTPNVSKGTSPRSSANPTPSPRTSNFERKNEQKAQVNEDEINRKSSLISLLLALGLLARRTLATATHTHSSLSGVEFFLHGLHALFKGDFRITSPRDEWVFADMDLLHSVVAPAVKMSLKLHQDHFLSPDEYDDPAALYNAITTHTNELVISHEGDPSWRNAVLRGAKQLLALRHVMEDGTDEYRLIRLSKRFLSFRVIKLNRECVRGLWAGQQQELIYLRNRNPERGSIQNAKQALRNIINSSLDQPLGYPCYVSPLTTSYAESNEQLCKIIGGAITFEKIKNLAWKFCQHVRQRCREGCSSGSATLDTEMGDMQMGVYYNAPTPNNTLSATTGTLSYGSQSLSGAANRLSGSIVSMTGKPTNSTLLAGFLIREREQERESVNADRSAGVYRKRGSVMSKQERERRATFPVASESNNAEANNSTKDMDAASSSFKPNVTAGDTASYFVATATTSQAHHHRPNSSFSSGNLSNPSRNPNRTIKNRKSKSEERQNSRDTDSPFEVPTNSKKDNLLGTSTSLPSYVTSATILDSVSQSTSKLTPTPSMKLPQPPDIPLNRKVIIVDSAEIYDCLDLGRRIDVCWPSEQMRLNGGRSSWKEWEPSEGQVGYTVHYWQPNHPDNYFRSNFNRTLFLVQIGERFVPISENGIKEYNTFNPDDRFRYPPPAILRDVSFDSATDASNCATSNEKIKKKSDSKDDEHMDEPE